MNRKRPKIIVRLAGGERTNICPQCRRAMTVFPMQPGHQSDDMVYPDYVCKPCHLAVFDTAADEQFLEDERQQYKDDTSFLPGK